MVLGRACRFWDFGHLLHSVSALNSDITNVQEEEGECKNSENQNVPWTLIENSSGYISFWRNPLSCGAATLRPWVLEPLTLSQDLTKNHLLSQLTNHLFSAGTVRVVGITSAKIRGYATVWPKLNRLFKRSESAARLWFFNLEKSDNEPDWI